MPDTTPHPEVRWRVLPVIVGAACLLALTACAVQPSSTPGQDAASASVQGTSPAAVQAPSVQASGKAAACTGSQVGITLTHTGAIAGQAGGYLTFTNRGAAPCTLTGYPAVAGLDAAGKSAELSRTTSTMFGAWQYVSPPPVVTLAPAGAAYAVVAGDDHPVGTAANCPAPYTRLKVTIPGGSAATTVSAWLPGAGMFLPTCATISGKTADVVSTVVPLSSLPH